MRFGEVLGLTWDCIKWQSKKIYTHRRYNSNNRKWTDPKTPQSVRYIPIDDDTLCILHQIKKEQAGFLLANPDQMLFFNVFYGIPSNNAANKYLQHLLQSLSIEPQNMTYTGNRHTYASILLDKYIDIWVVTPNMGHKDIKQITETDGHLIQEKAELENKKVRQALLTINAA